MKIMALGYEVPTTCQPVSRSTLLVLALLLGGPSRCVCGRCFQEPHRQARKPMLWEVETYPKSHSQEGPQHLTHVF